MKAIRVGVAMVAVIGAVLIGGADRIDAKDPAVQKIMGDNFASLQSILTGLIMSDYTDVPQRLKMIGEHATELTEATPEVAKGDRDRFVTYAYNLRAHAADLDSIVGLLIERDKSRAHELATDQLREAAAAHYGGMVTMCVACHNRFRPLDRP